MKQYQLFILGANIGVLGFTILLIMVGFFWSIEIMTFGLLGCLLAYIFTLISGYNEEFTDSRGNSK